MDDPFKRACVAFTGLSAGIFLIAYAMTANGGAVASNPAWHLISLLRNIFICLWVLLLTLAVITYLITTISERREASMKRDRLRREAEQTEAKRVANQDFLNQEFLKKEKEERVAKERAVAREQDRQRTIAQEIERRRRRSSEQAIDEALKDF